MSIKKIAKRPYRKTPPGFLKRVNKNGKKYCPNCKRVKSIKKFIGGYCEPCYSERLRVRLLRSYYKNKAKRLAYQKEYTQQHQNKVQKYQREYRRRKRAA